MNMRNVSVTAKGRKESKENIDGMFSKFSKKILVENIKVCEDSDKDKKFKLSVELPIDYLKEIYEEIGLG